MPDRTNCILLAGPQAPAPLICRSPGGFQWGLGPPQASNITKRRLASFDRPIVSEPRFTAEQAPGLIRDLSEYLLTLKVGLRERPDGRLLGSRRTDGTVDSRRIGPCLSVCN
jgi:hypothetical protein